MSKQVFKIHSITVGLTAACHFTILPFLFKTKQKAIEKTTTALIYCFLLEVGTPDQKL